MYDNGDLLVVFQGHNTFPFGVGSPCSTRAASSCGRKRTMPTTGSTLMTMASFTTVAHRLLDSPIELGNTGRSLICEDGKIYEDFVVVPRLGRQRRRGVLASRRIHRVRFAGLLERTRGKCDPLHLNDVRILKAEDADAYPDFAAGDIMVSTNAVNAVAVLDRGSRRIKWLTSGTMISQHNPRFAGDNRVLVFDNSGGTRIDGKGGSRIIGIDVASHLA